MTIVVHDILEIHGYMPTTIHHWLPLNKVGFTACFLSLETSQVPHNEK